jgi:hypothetical protein
MLKPANGFGDCESARNRKSGTLCRPRDCPYAGVAATKVTVSKMEILGSRDIDIVGFG